MNRLLKALNSVKNKMKEGSYIEASILIQQAIEAHEKQLSSTQDIVNIQCNDGNWNYDAYMHGMANGMLIVQSMFTDNQPVFLDAPDNFLESIPSNLKPEVASNE